MYKRQTLHINFLEKAGVELIRGWGRLTGPHSIGIASERDGPVERQLTATRVLIAVGGRPARPVFPGVEHAWISDDMFELKTYPESVIVVGAGFIACEFACILRGLGLSVTVVVRGESLLRGFDQELADAVLEGMRDSGIHVQFGVTVQSIQGEPGDLRVDLSDGLTIPCGGVLMATGRSPWLDGLGLESSGVHLEDGRIPVDPDQCTNVPHIYAVGDVTDRVNLTPVAIDEGRAFADTVYGGRPRRVDHDLVAMAVFSDPELASVGLSDCLLYTSPSPRD